MTDHDKSGISALDPERRLESDAKPGSADAELVEAIRAEHELSFLAAVKLYPKAIGWSAYVSMGVIMLAFDPQLVGNLYATPQFARDFGYEYKGEVRIPG